MKKRTLSVYASGQGREPRLEGQTGRDGDVLRYIGWQFVSVDQLKAQDLQEENVQGGWIVKSEPETIPYCPEYIRAIQSGSLLPADEATARICKVPFNKKSGTK